MPRLVPPSVKTEILRLRVEQRLSGPEIKKVVGNVSYPTIYAIVNVSPLTEEEEGRWRRSSRRAWGKDEVRILERMYPIADKADIEAALPRRRWPSIVKRANTLNISRTRLATNKKRRWVDPLFIQMRAIRDGQRIIRQELADKIGVHPQMIAHYELGQTIPSWRAFRNWMEALGCDLKIIQK